MANKDAVESRNSDIIAWEVDSKLPRSLMEGTKAMQAQGETFLPKDYMEQQGNYDTRLARSTLVNAFGKTVSFLSGQVFQKELVFSDDTPDIVIDRNKDIDLEGTGVSEFSKNVFGKGIAEGVCHIVVDTTNKGDEYNSRAEELAAGVRPYFQMVTGDSLSGYVDENGILLQIRVHSIVKERDGKFGVMEIEQIKVLEPGTWEIWQKDKKGKWLLKEDGVSSLDYIPIVSFIPGEQKSLMTGRSPLMDLAELNLNHWRSKSDQDNILHHARVPILFGKMLDVAEVTKSPYNLLNSNDEAGDLKYVEITGKAIESGAQDLKEIEAKMAMYGLQQLIPRTGSQTATEKALASSESNSSLGSWASDLEAVITEAFEIASDYENETYPDDMVSVNREYSVGILDPEMVNAYIALVESGILSAETAFSEIKRKGFIAEDLDWLEVVSQITAERRQSATMPDNFGE